MEQAHAVSPVYFISVTDEDSPESIRNSFSKLLKHSPFLTEIEHDTKAVVKLHFGEEGNTGYVKPLWVRVLCDVVQERGGTVVVSDTNTLYRGRRLDSADHLALAREHGFTQENLGCDCVIAGETNPDDTVTVPINQKHISDAKIARLYHDAGLLIGVAHFKGHVMCGFGGALKNIGMGCATREGKLAQHSSVSPEEDRGQRTEDRGRRAEGGSRRPERESSVFGVQSSA